MVWYPPENAKPERKSVRSSYVSAPVNFYQMPTTSEILAGESRMSHMHQGEFIHVYCLLASIETSYSTVTCYHVSHILTRLPDSEFKTAYSQP